MRDYYINVRMERNAYANEQNETEQTHAQCVVDAYLNLKHRHVLKRELFLTNFYNVPWKEILP